MIWKLGETRFIRTTVFIQNTSIIDRYESTALRFWYDMLVYLIIYQLSTFGGKLMMIYMDKMKFSKGPSFLNSL